MEVFCGAKNGKSGPLLSEARPQGGQLMVEAMVALGVIVIGLLGVLTLLSDSIGYNRVISEQYIAIYLASEGIETVKGIIDYNIINLRPWNQGIPPGPADYEPQYSDKRPSDLTVAAGRFLRFDSGSGLYSYGAAGTDTPYKRAVNIRLIGPDEIGVASKVYWVTRGGISMSVNLEDHFFNWRW